MLAHQSVLFGSSARILLIGENADDTHAISNALTENLRKFELITTDSELAALEMLDGRKIFDDPGYPELIILDLDEPETNGAETLSKIRKVERLKRVPIVAITTSFDEDSLKTFRQAGANKVILKAEFAKKCQDVVQLIVDYWFDLAFNPGNG